MRSRDCASSSWSFEMMLCCASVSSRARCVASSESCASSRLKAASLSRSESASRSGSIRARTSPRFTFTPGSAIHDSVPPTSPEMRASLRLTTVPVAARLAPIFSVRACAMTTGIGAGSAASASSPAKAHMDSRQARRGFMRRIPMA
jgi:hypothetical protein